jgi:hypothetical protein
MSDVNDDLTGTPLDATQLASDLRAARARIGGLVHAHRQSSEALARIAATAGVSDPASLDELARAVIAQLNSVALTGSRLPESPRPTPVITTGLVCEACGADAAEDMDDAVLCSRCSGADALAEASGRRLHDGAPASIPEPALVVEN